MIIGISGKKQVGKDTVVRMCNNLIMGQEFIPEIGWVFKRPIQDPFIVKMFAGKLKEITCLLTGCTLNQLEDESFKNTLIGPEWNKWKAIDIYGEHYYYNTEDELLDDEVPGPLIYKEFIAMTYRLFLQLLGTNCGRHIIHPNIWVNSLMNEYNPIDRRTTQDPDDSNINFPNWIISDVRFPNEVEAIRKHENIIIRVNSDRVANFDKHDSETALDDYTAWDYIIDNSGTKEELFKKVRDILIKENLIKENK